MESKNLVTYCITNEKKNILIETNLKIIVGGSHIKNEKFPNSWLLDSNNINISSKNKIDLRVSLNQKLLKLLPK